MTTVASALRSNLSRGWDIFADKGISTHVPYFAPIENGIIRLKNDCLVTTLRLNGFSFETADIDYVNLLQRQRNTAFRAISNLGSFALYTHVVRHKVRPSLPGTFADPFMARMDEVYQASISKNEMFVNDTYVSLVVRPVFRKGSFPSRILGVGGSVVAREQLRHMRDKLLEATRALEKSLDPYGPQVLRDVKRVEVTMPDGRRIADDKSGRTQPARRNDRLAIGALAPDLEGIARCRQHELHGIERPAVRHGRRRIKTCGYACHARTPLRRRARLPIWCVRRRDARGPSFSGSPARQEISQRFAATGVANAGLNEMREKL